MHFEQLYVATSYCVLLAVSHHHSKIWACKYKNCNPLRKSGCRRKVLIEIVKNQLFLSECYLFQAFRPWRTLLLSFALSFSREIIKLTVWKWHKKRKRKPSSTRNFFGCFRNHEWISFQVEWVPIAASARSNHWDSDRGTMVYSYEVFLPE